MTKFMRLCLVLSIPTLAALEMSVAQPVVSEKRPNILFCIADDASMQHMGAYGLTSWVKTPGFDRVSKEGILFNNAYTPNAKCSPSRACILTGRNPWQLEAAGNHVPFFPAKFITWIEELGRNGYNTGYTGKGWAPGNAGTTDGLPRMLTGQEFNAIKMAAPTKSMSPVNYAANFQEFLKTKESGQPFCFWYGGHEPHRVYEYGSGISKGKKKLSDITKVPSYWPDNETVRNDMLDYAYEIEYFDQHLVKMLEILKENGELENTIVVVTSDNGMPFPRVKGHIFEYDNHLPLAIMWQKGLNKPGRKISDYVSFIDLAPTFLEAAGLGSRDRRMQPIEGKSLLPIITSERHAGIDRTRDHVLLGKERTDVGRPHDWGYPVRAIIKKDYIFSINYEPDRWPAGNPETGYLDTDGSPTKTEILMAKRNKTNSTWWDLSFGKKPDEELYQISKDPDALTNLAADPAYAKIKNELKNQLEQELKKQGDPRMSGKGYVFDQYPFAEPNSRNFYERFMKGEKLKAGWVNPTDFEVIRE